MNHSYSGVMVLMAWLMLLYMLQAHAGAVFEIREDVLQDNAAYKFQFDQNQVSSIVTFVSYIPCTYD